MADDGNILSDLDLGTPGNGADTQPTAGIVAQYIKDLSVENPNSPKAFQWQGQPEIDIQFNIGATGVEGELHEVELKIVVTARAEQGTAYVVDLTYCGLVGIRNMEDSHAHAFLFAEGPRILFPFARRIVADAVRDAGFPPLMLDPIDFNGLYLQQLNAQQAQGESDAPVGTA